MSKLPETFTDEQQARIGALLKVLTKLHPLRDARMEAELRDLVARKSLYNRAAWTRAQEFDRKAAAAKRRAEKIKN
jgi:hypothetical protein